MKKFKVAIVGATGLVGMSVLKVLEEKKLPIETYGLFATKNSAGKIFSILGKDYIVEELKMRTHLIQVLILLYLQQVEILHKNMHQ